MYSVWGSDGEVRIVKLKFNIKIARHLAFSFMVMSLQVLKKEIFRGVFRTLSNVYNEVFPAEVVNVFQLFTIFAKKLRYSCST